MPHLITPIEEGLRNRENTETVNLVRGYKSTERKRSRDAITEVPKLHAKNEAQINDQLITWRNQWRDDDDM